MQRSVAAFPWTTFSRIGVGETIQPMRSPAERIFEKVPTQTT